MCEKELEEVMCMLDRDKRATADMRVSLFFGSIVCLTIAYPQLECVYVTRGPYR